MCKNQEKLFVSHPGNMSGEVNRALGDHFEEVKGSLGDIFLQVKQRDKILLRECEGYKGDTWGVHRKCR